MMPKQLAPSGSVFFEWPKYGIYAGRQAGGGQEASQLLVERILSGNRQVDVQTGASGAGFGQKVPILEEADALEPSETVETLRQALLGASLKRNLGRDVFGPSPPGVFVGREGYPKVSIGPMVSLTDEVPGFLDSPGEWFGKTLEEIVLLRAVLLRGKKTESVHAPALGKTKSYGSSRVLETVQQAAMSVRSVDVEARFTQDVRFSMQFSDVSQPSGPSASLQSARLAGNPVIPKKVDSLADESSEGLKAVIAAGELIDSGFDAYYVQKILSVGVLGQTARKKLVPTRWSITATDSMIANHYLEQVKVSPSVQTPQVFESTYLWNDFVVLVLPGAWSFEQFEAWMPQSNWHEDSAARNLDVQSNKPELNGGVARVRADNVQLRGAGLSVADGTLAPQNTSISEEYEPYEGRSDYAESQGGGYYASRFGAAEGLHHLRKQGRVIVFREIDPQYNVPVGVWQVRENVRHAFARGPTREFETTAQALAFLQKRLKVAWKTYWTKSRTLAQKSLADF